MKQTFGEYCNLKCRYLYFGMPNVNGDKQYFSCLLPMQDMSDKTEIILRIDKDKNLIKRCAQCVKEGE
jgi:hypothetical protein